jgi:hypothetical protein
MLPGTVNFFVGDDPEKWLKAIPTYGQVYYRQVYPGMDVAYYSRDGELEFDYIVDPGASPQTIALELAGADQLAILPRGSRREVSGSKRPICGSSAPACAALRQSSRVARVLTR